MNSTPPILENPLVYLVDLLESHSGRVVIGLAGVPGSGKTTITQKWATQINEHHGAERAKALSMDGFHLPKAELRQMPDPEKAFARRGAQWTFDAVGFHQKVRALKEFLPGTSVFWPDFEHEIGDPVIDTIEVPAVCQIALVEGLYLLYREGPWANLANSFDELWYLDTPLEVSITRLIARHQQAWGITAEQARHRVESSDYKNALLVQSTRPRADRLISSAN